MLKKKKSDAGDGDLFGDDSLFGDSGDLFGSEPEQVAATTTTDAPASSTTKASGTQKQKERTPGSKVLKGKLTEQERIAKFNEKFAFVNERIGRNPPAKQQRKPEQVRNTAWQHLFELALTKEQMEQITEIMPKWRESGRAFTERNAEAFVRTCF